MKYWLAAGTHANSQVAINKKIWGVQKKFVKSLKRVEIGDILIIFSRQEKGVPSAITAIFEIISLPYIDDRQIFKSHSIYFTEIYPLRIKLKSMNIFNKPIEFKSMVPFLNFISNKKYWSCHFRGRAITEIPEHDYQKIVEMNSLY